MSENQTEHQTGASQPGSTKTFWIALGLIMLAIIVGGLVVN